VLGNQESENHMALLNNPLVKGILDKQQQGKRVQGKQNGAPNKFMSTIGKLVRMKRRGLKR